MARPSCSTGGRGLSSFAWLILIAAVATFAFGLWARSAMQPQLTPLEKVIAQNEPEDHAHGIAVSSEDHLYVGSHLGVLTSPDKRRWQRLEGTQGDVESILVSATGQLYLAGPTIGLVLMEGQNSKPLLAGEVRAIALDPSRPGRLVAHQQGIGLLESLDSGQTWTNLALFAGAELLSLAIDPHDSAYLIAGGYRGLLAYSTDGGKSWTTVPALQGSVSALVFDPVNPGQLWAAVGGSLRLSPDRGVSWHSPSKKRRDRSVISLVFGPEKGQGPLGVTSEGYLFSQSQ